MAWIIGGLVVCVLLADHALGVPFAARPALGAPAAFPPPAEAWVKGRGRRSEAEGSCVAPGGAALLQVKGRRSKVEVRAEEQLAQDPCVTCNFNPSFVCLISGSCWGYSDEASCRNAGGAFCELPSCGSDEIIMNQQCIKKLDTDSDRWVRAHNIFRCMHNAPYVTWSASAAENAQAYVDTLTGLAHSDSYNIPAPAGPAGENLAMGQSDLEAATNAWYQEVVDCSWPGCMGSTNGNPVGHFTAMIWKATTEIGCAVKNSASIFICRYLNAPSNYGADDAYAQNVAEPTKSFETCIAELESSVPAPSTAPAPEPSPTAPAPHTTPAPEPEATPAPEPEATPAPEPTTPARTPQPTRSGKGRRPGKGRR